MKKIIPTLSLILFILSVFLPVRAEEISKYGKYKKEKVAEWEETDPKEKLAHHIDDYIYLEKTDDKKEIKFSRKAKAKAMRKQNIVNAEQEAEKNKFVVQNYTDLIKVPDNSKLGFRVKYENKNRLKIIKLKQYGLPEDELVVYSGYQGTIRGGYPLNIDKNNNIYVLLEGYISQDKEWDSWTSDILEMFIDIFNDKGELVDEVPLERHDVMSKVYTIPKQDELISLADILVTEDGDIYIQKEIEEGKGIKIFRLSK